MTPISLQDFVQNSARVKDIRQKKSSLFSKIDELRPHSDSNSSEKIQAIKKVNETYKKIILDDVLKDERTTTKETINEWEKQPSLKKLDNAEDQAKKALDQSEIQYLYDDLKIMIELDMLIIDRIKIFDNMILDVKNTEPGEEETQSGENLKDLKKLAKDEESQLTNILKKNLLITSALEKAKGVISKAQNIIEAENIEKWKMKHSDSDSQLLEATLKIYEKAYS